MSLQSVRDFLSARAPDLSILEMPTSTATVPEAAAAHGVQAGQIAKTLSLWLKGEVIVLVMSGDTKVDNQKFKARFGSKVKMLGADEVVALTGHPVGGVCPFGLPDGLKVFADVALKRFSVVLPAAGATNAALRVEPERLALLVSADWVDVGQPVAAASPKAG